MAVSRSALLLLLLLLLVLVSTEMGPKTVAEARTCISQSHSFRGACISRTNCASVCRTENFPDGDCKTQGLTRKCYCVKQCR